ncbi:acyl carrier protein [Prosthecobacter fluviatilis]|uniref:Acyl carrier protein n=1 Tax=Prosthecobacter fluviatilis TaxID=445931 RepID=A0ABW0KP68_9BACT
MPDTVAITPGTMIELVRETVLPDLPADFSVGADLFEAGLDSMGVMQLVMYLEERFGKKVEPAELSRANFRSGLAMVALVKGQASGA